jgi:hypothetical protein
VLASPGGWREFGEALDGTIIEFRKEGGQVVAYNVGLSLTFHGSSSSIRVTG